MSNRPRHTMSRHAPLACRHCPASQSLVDSVRRLAFGCCSISARIERISSWLIFRPRYLNSTVIEQQYELVFFGKQGVTPFFFVARLITSDSLLVDNSAS